MASAAQTAPIRTEVASRRILRMALGTTLSMGFSQIIDWPLSFIAAVITLFLLAVPLPTPTLKSGLKFVLALVIPAYTGMLLLPILLYAHWAGILLVVLALFGSFYYSASGGSPIMGMFMTLGLTLVVTIGSVSADAMLMVINGVAIGAGVGIAFVVIAHTLLPDLPAPPNANAGVKPPTPPPKPSALSARRNALRSLSVVLPLVLIFLFMNSSTSYVVVMIKVATMGQQANSEVSRRMAVQQLESTFWGGVGALIAFQIMSIWSSLIMFCLIIALACLIYGRRIFQGSGMHPKGAMWSYALVTMVVVLTPAVTGGGDVAAAFYTRLMLFIAIALYGTIAVVIFDTFWPGKAQKGYVPGSPQ